MVMIPSIHPFVPFIPGDKVTMDLTTLEGSDVSSSAGGSGDNSEDDGYGGLVKPCGGAEGSASASSDASSDAAAASTVSLSSTPPSAGRSRSASIDLLASAAFMTAPQVSQPPQPEKRERIDSISSLMEAVEQRSRSNSFASNHSDGQQHKYRTRGKTRSFSNPEGMERYEMSTIPVYTAATTPQNRTLQLMEELERRKDETVSYEYAVAYPYTDFAPNYTVGAKRGRPPTLPKAKSKFKTKSKFRFSPSSGPSRRPSIDLSTVTVVDVVPDPLTAKVSYDSLRQKKEPLLDAMSKADDRSMYPHAIGDYKSVYNKDGRVGIYTSDERMAILERFRDKRARRVWIKKIRYGCRKNLADRRIRVKGRFVKMTPEQSALALAKQQEEQQQQQQTPEIYERSRRYTIG